MQNAVFALLSAQIVTTPPPPDEVGFLNAKDAFPYRTAGFSNFVNASFNSSQGSNDFYNWFESSSKKKGFRFSDQQRLNLTSYLNFKHHDLDSTINPELKVKKEKVFAASLFALVKRTLPKFSLSSGYEFTNAVSHGQRQCFLQSVLIAGLLQKGGVPAGVAMVNRNIQGQETNNKHAICLVRLANRHDLIVDASEDAPFAKQQGLYLDSPQGYRFVRPSYVSDDSIVAYRSYDSGAPINLAEIRPMPRKFVRSQFDYYRGEQIPGGVLAKQKNPNSLAVAAQHLAKSVAEDPENSLPTYMLGRVDLYLGQKTQAGPVLAKAMHLYSEQGWVPPDERTALSLAGGNPIRT